ncbi:MAG: FadR/GntR family transcriptional regulator [Lachnospiraceae bacterium]
MNNKLKSIESNNKLLPEKVAEQIIQLIKSRKLQVGEKLPNEFDMAGQLNVGRGTIREAVKILVSKNIVEIRRGCGTFVCEHPGKIDDPLGLAFVPDQSKLALDLCEIRMIIEPEIAALAAKRATEEAIAMMEQAAKEVEELCANGMPHMEKDIEFHELIARSTDNQVMPNIIPVIQTAISLFINVTDSSLTNQTIVDHRKILEGIKAHNSSQAKAAMILHLERNKEKIQLLTGLK